MTPPLEYKEQQKFVNWLKVKKLFHFAINNENQLSKANRAAAAMIEAKAKSMGKKKGASDIVVMLKDAAVFIEIKRAKKSLSKVSDEQKEFLKKVQEFDYARGFVAYGAEEAIQIIESFL